MTMIQEQITDTELSGARKLRLDKIDARNENNAVTLLASIRYKSEDESEHPTDRYGYIQTELQPIMTLRNLSEEEVSQVKEFVEDTIAQRTIHATRKKSIGEKLHNQVQNKVKKC